MTDLMQEIQSLREDVRRLGMLIMKDKVDTTWISEEDAAHSLGITPQTLRKGVKRIESGNPSISRKAIRISYRTTNGRNYQYSRKDLINYKNKTAVVVWNANRIPSP